MSEFNEPVLFKIKNRRFMNFSPRIARTDDSIFSHGSSTNFEFKKVDVVPSIDSKLFEYQKKESKEIDGK